MLYNTMKNKKNITIGDLDNRFDELSTMIAKGFENTVNKQDFSDFKLDVNNRLGAVDKRLGKLEFQVDEVHDILKRFEENDILNLQKRVQILEKAVRALATSQSSK